jgi:hypothetical protein
MTGAKLPQTWCIGLSAWMIQDGNYPDLVVGQTAEFAVEFYQPPDAEITPSSDVISVTYLRDCTYDVVADLVVQTSKLAVLNIGILAYCENRSDSRFDRNMDRIRTRVHLGLDPFFYFESLAKIEGVPSLVYSWRIDAILRQTAPFIETPLDPGGKMLVRDQTKLRYEETQQTKAWTDDGGHAEYVLRCELLEISPKRESATAL